MRNPKNDQRGFTQGSRLTLSVPWAEVGRGRCTAAPPPQATPRPQLHLLRVPVHSPGAQGCTGRLCLRSGVGPRASPPGQEGLQQEVRAPTCCPEHTALALPPATHSPMALLSGPPSDWAGGWGSWGLLAGSAGAGGLAALRSPCTGPASAPPLPALSTGDSGRDRCHLPGKAGKAERGAFCTKTAPALGRSRSMPGQGLRLRCGGRCFSWSHIHSHFLLFGGWGLMLQTRWGPGRAGRPSLGGGPSRPSPGGRGRRASQATDAPGRLLGLIHHATLGFLVTMFRLLPA